MRMPSTALIFAKLDRPTTKPTFTVFPAGRFCFGMDRIYHIFRCLPSLQGKTVAPKHHVQAADAPNQLALRQALKGALAQQPLRRDIANSTLAKNVGWLHPVAFSFLSCFVSLDFGLTTVSSCFRIWLETVRDQPAPTLPARMFVITRDLPSSLFRALRSPPERGVG
jgi:hypothetical protein